MATSKSGGSTGNGRDSHSKRLGAKLADGQFALAGGIIYRQRGTKVHPGNNVGKGGDDTLFTLIDGYVKFEQRRNRTYASVYANKLATKDKPINKKTVGKTTTVKKSTASKTSASSTTKAKIAVKKTA